MTKLLLTAMVLQPKITEWTKPVQKLFLQHCTCHKKFHENVIEYKKVGDHISSDSDMLGPNLHDYFDDFLCILFMLGVNPNEFQLLYTCHVYVYYSNLGTNQIIIFIIKYYKHVLPILIQ